MEGNFPHNFSAVRPSMFSGCTPSSSVHAQFLVDPDSSYASYNLISAAGTSTLVFSIDEHPMYVYAVDGRYVEPIRVDAVTISNGIRYSVLIQLNQPVGDYTIRLATTGANQILNTTATLSYNTTDKTLKRPSLPSIDITGTLISSNYTALDESTIVPFPVELPPQDVAQTRVLNIDRFNASYRWTLGNTSLPLAAEDRAPLLFYPETTQTSLSIATLNGTWVDLILLVQPFQPPHPIHKHSNKFFVIGQGEGQWNYSSVAEAMQHIPQSFNLKTPQIRDTYYTPAAVTAPSWLAIRYHVVNPGAFLLHCHIQVHLSGGMGLPLLDGVDEWPELPEEYWLAEGV
jgi:FtsP/CotA-like multicopper oxidase with cupredoxin domain